MWALFLTVVAAWEPRGSVDGITIESQPVAGSTFETVRLTKRTNVPVDIQADAIWYSHEPATKEVAVHRIIEETPSARVFYEVVKAPVISDRDVVVRVERTKNGDTHRITFRSIADPRMPLQKDKIRMTVSGSFEVSPDGQGGSIVSYQVFTDLGGSVPGWMVNGPKRDALVSSFQAQLLRGYKRQAYSMQDIYHR